MIKQGILKNLKKFNNIKLAKGINAQFFVTERRIVNMYSVGISTETFGDKWFLTPKGRAIFKTFDSDYTGNIRNIRILNELLCKSLCDQIGLDCAEYELAHIENADGLLTYDISEGKKLISFSKFMSISKKLSPNLFDCAVAIDKYVEKGYKINKKDIITSMYKTILFDALTMQTDRNAQNFNLLYNSKKREFTPAKLIDNEFAFCGELLSSWIENDYGYNFKMHDILYEYNMTSKMLTFDDDYVASLNHLRENIENLVLYAKKHTSLMKILGDVLKKIDGKKAFEDVEKTGIAVNNDYKKFVCFIIDDVKEMILHEKSKSLTKQELADVEKMF